MSIKILEQEQESSASTLDIPTKLPVLPLDNAVVFPMMVTPLMITDDYSGKLVDDVAVGSKCFAIVTAKNFEAETPTYHDLYRVGVVARILKLFRMPDGAQNIIIQAVCRIRLERQLRSEPYITAEVTPLPEEHVKGKGIDVLMTHIKNLSQQMIEHFEKRRGRIPPKISA
ncbi:LON peptidase substrate-binding domain-containing protein, partial [Candidatus Hydrogenedentota bacterium]